MPVIRLKRHIGSALTPTAGTGATQLSVGELAYERQSADGAGAGPDNLWVSSGANVHPLVSSARQVELAGAQTVSGVKTFSAFPVFPAGVANQVLSTTDAAGTLAWSAPVAIPPALILKGEFNASTGTTGAVENAVAPLTNGPLPVASAANNGFFVICSTEGSPTTGNGPHDHIAVGDWIVSVTDSGGTSRWIHINLHFAIVAASNVSINAITGMTGVTDVQVALEWLHAQGVTVSLTAPATPRPGMFWFDTTTPPGTLNVYNGTTWVSAMPPGAAATVVSDQTSIHGDGAATGTYPATGPLTVALVDGGAYA